MPDTLFPRLQPQAQTRSLTGAMLNSRCCRCAGHKPIDPSVMARYGVPHAVAAVPDATLPEPHVVEDAAMSLIASAGTVNGIRIDDTFAEGYDMAATGVVITAPTARWAEIAARAMTGFATSVEVCGVEAGIDRELAPDETPDGRPGFRVLLFGLALDTLRDQLARRVRPGVFTSPGSAVYCGLEGGRRFPLGLALRHSGGGSEVRQALGNRSFWRIPVLDGEFVAESTTGSTTRAIGGGGFLILARSHAEALAAAESAVEAALTVPDVILPFPGGLARSRLKIAPKPGHGAAADAFCPTLRGTPGSMLEAETGAVIELVINGLHSDAIREAMKRSVRAVVSFGAQRGIQRLSARNGDVAGGGHPFHLRDLI